MRYGDFTIAMRAASANPPPTTMTSQMNPISKPAMRSRYTRGVLAVAYPRADTEAMMRIGSIVWGVRDVPRAIEFWTAALDYRPLREPDADWAILVPKAGHGPQLAITEVTSAAAGHQRHHLDLYAFDQDVEVERLLSLGAAHVDWDYEDNADYVVLCDPDGNRFCVVAAGDAANAP